METASAVSMLLLLGYPNTHGALSQVARQYNRSPATVLEWWRKHKDTLSAPVEPIVRTDSEYIALAREELRDLLAGHLRVLLPAMNKKLNAASYGELSKGLDVIVRGLYLLDAGINSPDAEAQTGPTITVISRGVSGLPVTMASGARDGDEGDGPV